MNKKYLLGICLLSFGLTLFAEDGSKLWLRQASCEKASVCCSISSPTIAIAREELASLWRGKAVELQLFLYGVERRLNYNCLLMKLIVSWGRKGTPYVLPMKR